MSKFGDQQGRPTVPLLGNGTVGQSAGKRDTTWDADGKVTCCASAFACLLRAMSKALIGAIVVCAILGTAKKVLCQTVLKDRVGAISLLRSAPHENWMKLKAALEVDLSIELEYLVQGELRNEAALRPNRL